jgi:hypothetical protein
MHLLTQEEPYLAVQDPKSVVAPMNEMDRHAVVKFELAHAAEVVHC